MRQMENKLAEERKLIRELEGKVVLFFLKLTIAFPRGPLKDKPFVLALKL